MFHRIGLEGGRQDFRGRVRAGADLLRHGNGIHIAASKCPHVHAAVCESVPAAKRAITGNNCNVLAMGAFYVSPQMGHRDGGRLPEQQPGRRLRVVAQLLRVPQAGPMDELEAFDYEAFKRKRLLR